MTLFHFARVQSVIIIPTDCAHLCYLNERIYRIIIDNSSYFFYIIIINRTSKRLTMSQQIKLSSLPYADTRAVKSFTEQYQVNRTIWKGCKAILNKLKGRDPSIVSTQTNHIKAELKRTQNNMYALRAMIWSTIKEDVRRARNERIAVTAQQTVTMAPQVDQNMVNTLRTLFDANPQLKAQVQALLAIVALQTVQPHQ